MKQAIIVRKDLKMGCGKIAGQACHASRRAISNLYDFDEEGGFKVRMWIIKDNEPKIILKVHSEEELIEIMLLCDEKELIYGGVRDAGKTQIDAGTLTAVAIGPYPDDIIDGIVGDLKLL